MPPKGILPFTYHNAKTVAKSLEETGYRPIQELVIENLGAGNTATDRRTFHVEGNAIIIPPRPISVNYFGDYNLDVDFGISFNSPGEDNDDWMSFTTRLLANRRPVMTVDDVLFYQLTVRNEGAAWTQAGHRIKMYIVQDPNYIIQLNKLVKDLVQ